MEFNSPQILGLFIIQQVVIRGNVIKIEIFGHEALHIEYLWNPVSVWCVWDWVRVPSLVQQVDLICRSRDIYGMLKAEGEGSHILSPIM